MMQCRELEFLMLDPSTKYKDDVAVARYLIEVRVGEALKDNITMGIPLPQGTVFSKETNATTIPNVDMNNDGFQTVVNKRKSGKTCSTNTYRSGVTVGKATWQPIKPKVRFEPKSHGNSPKNGAPNVSTYAKDGPNSMHMSSKKQTTKVVDLPSSSFTSDTAKKGALQVPTSSSNIPTSNPYDVLDDMESKEEVEVVFDETANFHISAKPRTGIYTTPGGSKT
ncbi:hypothetical protein Tco_0116121 [Tanacetum coccineum]